jgi:two-component system C4-dicarboxylate transport response regulator DctD
MDLNDTPDIRVILVEDETDVRLGCTQALELEGFGVDGFGSVEEARHLVVPGVAACVLADVRLPGLSGAEWLPQVRVIDPDLPVILVTGHGDIAMAVRAMRDGAYDFIEKPFTSERLVSVVRRALDKRRLTLQVRELRDHLESWHGIQSVLVGRSPEMARIRRNVLTLAATPADVVIYGETGTGKELVARCLHDHSDRRRGNFVALNCGGLPENLAEAELFGHEMGAFTGAARSRVGKFEHASGGTLFLDEIESMSMAVQVKLLRTLQERSIERIGSNKSIAVDCRVVAASKEDLKALSEAQKFRADLYYRLGVAFIELPSLRDRREDIPLLFEHFSFLAAARFQRAAPALTREQLSELLAHSWPGNVRELHNVADRFVLGLVDDGAGLISDAHRSPAHLHEQTERFERTVITEELRRHKGDVAQAAKALGVPKQTFYDKVKRLKVPVEMIRGHRH